MKNKYSIGILIILTILVTACSPSWEITLLSSEQSPQKICHQDVTFYLEKSVDAVSELPLGQVLYAKGFTLIDGISFTKESGGSETYEWDLIASKTTITSNGTVKISGEEIEPKSIQVQPARHFGIQYSIMDIAPTMAHALGLLDLPEAVGVNRTDGSADYGVMILLDGLQYEKLTQLMEAGQLPFFQLHQDSIQM